MPVAMYFKAKISTYHLDTCKFKIDSISSLSSITRPQEVLFVFGVWKNSVLNF